MTDVLDPTLSDITLQDYITDAQRLLHDATYRFYSQSELTDYVNKARRKVAAETGCTRQIIAGVPLSASLASISFLDLLAGRRIIGLLDVYVYYGSTRVPIAYYPYSQFSRSGPVIYATTGTPAMWSQVGARAYVSPIPVQDETADFDAAVEPADLVDLTDTDYEVTSPFPECVKFYVCYLAKIKDQKRTEAEHFLHDYMRERNSISSSTMIRKLVGA
jgi:hypothetical protein